MGLLSIVHQVLTIQRCVFYETWHFKAKDNIQINKKTREHNFRNFAKGLIVVDYSIFTNIQPK